LFIASKLRKQRDESDPAGIRIFFPHKNEYRIFKPVKITIRRGLS
jgi:hypothetical protein